MSEQLKNGDIETMSNRGQWINRVIGSAELSESFSSREEAVDAGRSLAQQLGARHVVTDAESTGAVTDEDPSA